MARQNNYPIFENNSTVITAEFLNGLVNNVKTLNQEDGVFDISIANAVSGVPITYNSLELALSGTNIPVDVRKGGMAVKFINSGTGEYEQWVLKASSFSTTESDWASVTNVKADDVSYGSSNVKEELNKIGLLIEGGTQITRYESTAFVNDGTIDQYETQSAWEGKKYTNHINLISATYIKAVCLKNQYSAGIRIFNAEGVQLSSYANPSTGYMNGLFEITDIPEGAAYGVFIADMRSGGDTPYIEVSVQGQSIDERINNAVNEAGIYDISDNNSGVSYDSLSDALGLNAVNIPTGIRKGGMSVKYKLNIYADYKVTKTEELTTEPTGTELASDPYINSGTYKASELTSLSVVAALPSTIGKSNAVTYYLEVSGDTTTYTSWVVEKMSSDTVNYVQWRYMLPSILSADLANPQNWQGIDSEPIKNSSNLLMSGGMYNTHLIVEGGEKTEYYDSSAFCNSGVVDVDGNSQIDDKRAHTNHIGLEDATYIKACCYKNQYAAGIRIFNAEGTQLQSYNNPPTGYMNGVFEITSIPVGAAYGIFIADIRQGGDVPYVEIKKNVKPILKVLEDKTNGQLPSTTRLAYNSTWMAENSLEGKSVDGFGYIADSSICNLTNPINIAGANKIVAMAIANAYARWCVFYDENGHFISWLPSSSGFRNKLLTAESNDIPTSAVYARFIYDNRADAPLPYLYIYKSTDNIVKADNNQCATLVNKRSHEKALRFAYITDMHYRGSDSDWDSDGFTEDEKIAYLRDCILTEHRKNPLDFCISTGDSLLIDNKTKAEALQIGMDFRNVFIKQCPFPLFTCVGNHDSLDDEDWIKVFGHSRQYSFETETMYFIAIDQMHHSDGTSAYTNKVDGVVKWHNIGLDYDYLDAEIAKAKELDKDVVIFFHFFYAMNDDDNTSISTFYQYCHNKGVHLVLYGHQHGAENWNTHNNTLATNTYTDLYGICAGWFAHRDSYPANSQKWGFFIIEIADGIMTATNYYVAHNYTSEVAYPLGNVEASSNTKTIDTLQYYPIRKASYQLWKFKN